MKKRTKIAIIIFVIFFIFCYVKLGTFIDRKWQSYWYKRNLKSFSYYDEEGVKHFPKELPKSAKCIKYFEDVGRSGIGFCLKMKADKQWILAQINSYEYIEIESPDDDSPFYRKLSSYLEEEGLKYYIIYRDKESYHPYYYGLAVNKNCTRIVYYFERVRH